MYVSKTHQAAFVHIPKTGGTAIRTQALWRAKWQRVGHKHGTIAELPDHCGGYFLFTVVRNPYKRFASQYRFRRIRHDDEFVELYPSLYDLLTSERYQHAVQTGVLPMQQAGYIDERVHWYRFEEIKQRLPEICQRVGVKPARLRPSQAVHHYGPYDWREEIDCRALEYINDTCRDDFEAFGYDMLTWGQLWTD